MLSAFSASMRNQRSEQHIASDVELGGVERQMSQPTTHPTLGPTQERLTDTRLSRSQTMQARATPTTAAEPNADEPENFAFVCIRRFEETFVTTAHFCWPSRKRIVWQESPRTVHDAGNSHTTGSEQHGTTVRHRTTGSSRRQPRGVPREIQQGSQVEVMQAIRDAAYAQVGTWRRFVPFLELQAQEVLFRFDSAFKHGRAKAVIERLDPVAILADIEKEVPRLRAVQANDYDPCFESMHSDSCDGDQDLRPPYTCYADTLRELVQRQEGIKRRHELRECVETPAKIEHRDWLSTGLVQKSFIYKITTPVYIPRDEPSVNRNEQHRAVFVYYRWNIERFSYHRTLLFTMMGFPWIVALVWAGITRDANTAAAIGSFLMSTVRNIV